MIYRMAAQEGVAVYELAYPWEGFFVWYGQDACLHIHKSQQLLSQRHKGKLLVQIARVRFISLCIETWGYSNFLQIEETKSGRRLMRGQPGRSSVDAKTYTGPTIENLYELFRRNRAEYNRKIKNASKPFCLDDGGLDSITSMLEHKVKAKEPSSSESEGEWAEETESKCHVKPSSDEDSEEENSPPKKPKSKRSTSSENLKAESSSSSKRVKAERPPSPSRVKSEGAPPSVLAKEACFAAFFR
ncbi:hypothetical protein PI125_g22862 [Phytophthora idaei]|nr:hypothetical protein PI125_g22862 [Phytophthora idaei]